MYAVQYVKDEELPTNQAWAMIRQGPRYCLFIKASQVTPEVLEEAWAGFRRMVDRIPAQRSSSTRDSSAAIASPRRAISAL